MERQNKVMNILFFLKPKNDVAFLYDDCTVRQALEKMKHYRYSAIPLIDREGRYVGTVTEGDFLWMMLDENATDIKDTEQLSVNKMARGTTNQAVCIDAKIEDLLLMTMNQNFVPVIDDRKIFIGIVTRKDILQYFYEKLRDDFNKQV